MLASSEKKEPQILDILNGIIQGKVDANRRYIDQVLEKIQDANHRYYLQKMVVELTQMELEEKAGNLQGAFQHKVLAETYKGILEKAFGITE